MKTKNEVLLLSACMMMFFRESNVWKITDLLTDDELYQYVDLQIDITEDLYLPEV